MTVILCFMWISLPVPRLALWIASLCRPCFAMPFCAYPNHWDLFGLWKCLCAVPSAFFTQFFLPPSATRWASPHQFRLVDLWRTLDFGWIFAWFGSGFSVSPKFIHVYLTQFNPEKRIFSRKFHIQQRFRADEKRDLCTQDCGKPFSQTFRLFRFLDECFNATLGFPGEGPSDEKTWSLISANINSFATNVHWKTWNDEIICAQETRLGKNNLKTVSRDVKENGKHLYHGELLPGLIMANGRNRTQHGGVAILASHSLTLPFDPKDDITGLYTKLVKTKRVTAVWAQVIKSIRALIVNIYAQTAASSDPIAFDYNESLLVDVFELVSQFGDIPSIITGDFQLTPTQYPSVSNAVNFQSWSDPLAHVDQCGDPARALTYSRDGLFTGIGDACSSIDGILLNQIAFAALQQIEVLELYNVQHRPIRACFEWSVIHQHGFVLTLPATLLIDDVPRRNQHEKYSEYCASAQKIWDEKFHDAYEDAGSSEDKWQIINDSLIDTLLTGGARWGQGSRTRGQKPKFTAKTICPGQTPSYGSTTWDGTIMKNTLGRLWELHARLQRPIGTDVDACITRKLALRTWFALKRLKAPYRWTTPSHPDLVTVHYAIIWVQDVFCTWQHQRKILRLQQWRAKIRASATGTKSYIYQHLRNKARDEPANLITDSKGNIIYQPDCALKQINEEWDNVFAVNALHDHPLQVLHTIWPYISHSITQYDLPPIQAEQLFDIIQARKKTAAPGLDGWRTSDLQALPKSAFVQIAKFFQLVEATEYELPSILGAAKQQILNKNGDSSPLQKRLITILPALLLSYTGARFCQLQEWQQLTMSPSLHGGIKGRFMTDVPFRLRLELDHAAISDTPMIGLKLDKAKCFDRLLPDITAALFTALGVSTYVTRFFVKMYKTLTRHLAYKNWVSPTATTAANGVAQGCSLSLLAINVHMHVWAEMLSRLPELCIHAFIDDAYIWARLDRLSTVQAAIQVTQAWDLLSGQLLNEHKCTIWGTTTAARKRIKKAFPNMKLALEFDLLGTLILTSKRDAFHFTDDKVQAILADARNIAALPITRVTKEQVIAARVVPKCCFTSSINCLPKKVVSKISTAVVSSLWYRRPHWRARWLVFGLLSQPHRVEPEIARAYVGICDFLRFLHRNEQLADMCRATITLNSEHKHIFMHQVRAQFAMLQLQLHDDLSISFGSGQRVPYQELTTLHIKQTLQHLGRHTCYERACDKNRKDLNKPGGILDFDLTSTFWRHSKLKFHEGLPANVRFDSQVVGCLLTNDRLFAAKIAESAQCRFCGAEKESLPHLIQECPALPAELGPLIHHELGNNFVNVGIVEHPKAIIRHRLQHEIVDDIRIATFSHPCTLRRLWVDGSLHWPQHFWLQAGGFSVIDEFGNTCFSGPVRSWKLTSFTTELWALVIAVTGSNSKVHIFSDCKSVVEKFHELIRLEKVPPHWIHRTWWSKILQVWLQRKIFHPFPIQVTWIPAHAFPHVPFELISADMAKSLNTTCEHIRLNRIADFAAKKAAVSHTAVHPSSKQWLLDAILKHHEWLTCLHKALACETLEDSQQNNCYDKSTLSSDPLPSDEPYSCSQAMIDFPQWMWAEDIKQYKWRPKILLQFQAPAKAKLDQDDCKIFLQFLDGVKWRTGPSLAISYAELAILFLASGYRMSSISHFDCTVKDVISLIRRMMTMLHGIETMSAFPGIQRADTCRSSGRCFPSGLLEGAFPWFPPTSLLVLAKTLNCGAGKRLTSWTIPVVEIFN